MGVYTVPETTGKIVQIARNGEGWEDPVKMAGMQVQDASLLTQLEKSSIGVCRERTGSDGTPIFVFYKPRAGYIDVGFSPIEPVLTASVVDSFRPRGIPVSI